MRRKLTYVLGCGLTASFLLLMEQHKSYALATALIVAATVGIEIWMYVSKTAFHGLNCATAILLGIGNAYQALFGYDSMKYTMHLVLFYAAAAFAFFLMRARMETTDRQFCLLTLSVVLLLAANQIFGQSVNGARLWLKIGKTSVQVSELLKFLLIILGAMAYRNRKRIVCYGMISFVCCAVLLWDHDFGNAAVIFATLLLMLYLLLDNRILSASSIAVSAVGFFTLASRFPYARDRVARWLHVMSAEGAEQQRTMIKAILLGGFRGLGYSQNGYVTRIYAADTDMSLAGVWAVYGLPVLLTAFLAYFLIISQAARNNSVYPAAYLIISQVSVVFFCQVVLNFGGSADILPFTGLVAPLISRGGTSMVTFGAMLGAEAAALNPVVSRKEGVS